MQGRDTQDIQIMPREPRTYPATAKKLFRSLGLSFALALLSVGLASGLLTITLGLSIGITDTYVMALAGAIISGAVPFSALLYRIRFGLPSDSSDEGPERTAAVMEAFRPEPAEVIVSLFYTNAILALAYLLSAGVAMTGLSGGAILLAFFYPIIDYELLGRFEISPAMVITQIGTDVLAKVGYIRNVPVSDLGIVHLARYTPA